MLQTFSLSASRRSGADERAAARPALSVDAARERSAGGDARRPDDSRRFQSLAVGESNRVRLDFNHRTAELNVDALLLELALRVGARGLGKRGQQLRREIDESHADLRGVQSKAVALDHDVDEL